VSEPSQLVIFVHADNVVRVIHNLPLFSRQQIAECLKDHAVGHLQPEIVHWRAEGDRPNRTSDEAVPWRVVRLSPCAAPLGNLAIANNPPRALYPEPSGFAIDERKSDAMNFDFHNRLPG
jgi:hypothetical protein